jgi:MinD superfamily P-loop ATPase
MSATPTKGAGMMGWKKQKPIDTKDLNIGCVNCSTASLKANMDRWVCTGFGAAFVTKDGHTVYDGESDYQKNESCKTVGDIEKMAKEDPDHDWQIVFVGPMHGETFQRHGDAEWVCIESDPGFA